ncbi:hypothetical protein GLOIN_2v1875369 [Rhizophagus clarus]|uniref:Uncharacterized protein n=1 Tax=Rhizophagus clarus TaxID=94130 RepID=A0A8H3M3N5_9GLOM|nr:hypothetical protein GLOIN_2v1875369 [Rhizophagus clarus]
MFPNEEAYTLRLENYRRRYVDNDLCASLEELYKLYYHIAKEENRERSDDEIEQMLRAIKLHNMESLDDIIEDTNKNIKKVFLAEVAPEFRQEAYIIGLKLTLDRLARERVCAKR